MNKFNKLGMEVIEHKSELLKADYPEIVKKALESQVDGLQTSNIIDLDLHYGLKDGEMGLAEFKKLIENKEGTELLKSPEELLEEYDVLRVKFEEQLLQSEGVDFDKIGIIKTESKPLEEEVHVILSFNVDGLWAENYFTASDGESVDIDKMMSRKGFVERFVILRYSKLMADFLRSIPGYNQEEGRVEIVPNVKVSGSPVLFNVEEELYSIEFMVYVDVNVLENDDYGDVISATLEQLAAVSKYFEERTVA